VHVGRSPAQPVSVDPMLDELAAQLVATHPEVAQAPSCLSPVGQVVEPYVDGPSAHGGP
jgi:hypothetical protein